MLPRYRTLLAAVALVALALPARAQTFVEFFPTDGDPGLHGLDYHDGALWAAVRSSSDPRILQLDPADGTTLSTVSLAVDFTPVGVTWDGTDFWLSESFTSSPELFRVSASGDLLGSIPAPSDLSNGLAWRDGPSGDTLWVAKADPNDEASLVAVDPADGAELRTLPFPETQPAGIAFLGDGTLWASNVGDDGSNIERLYRLDAGTGAVIETLDLPTGVGRPKGLAYDGEQFLYLVARRDEGFADGIYKIDLGTSGNAVYNGSTDTVTFGQVSTDETEQQTFTVTNDGDAPLVITDVVIVGTAEFFTSFKGATVAPGASVAVTVGFSPTEYGPKSGILTFETNDVAAQQVEVLISGFGVFPEPTVAFVEDQHDFGDVRIEDPYETGGRAERLWPVRIINQGLGTLEVESVEIEGDDAEAFFILEGDVPLFLFEVGTADTVAVWVGFRPETVGEHTAEAVFLTNAPFDEPYPVALSGTGIDPEIEGGDALWTLTVPDNPATSFDDPKVSHLAAAGDLTSNGKPDLVAGTESYLVFAIDGNGWGTGDTLWTFNTCPDNFNCGSISGGGNGIYETALATGFDIDGDGTNDVVFSTDGGSDHVYALSGADGSVIWEVGSDTDPYLAPYYSVSARFDVTGDGVPDVTTGTGTASAQSPDPFNERRVYTLDGATGAELWQRSPGLPSFVVQQIRLAEGKVLALAGGRSEGLDFLTAYDAGDGSVAWTHDPETIPFTMEPYPLGDGGEDALYSGNDGFTATNRLVRLDGETGAVVWEVTFLPTVWDVETVEDLNGNGTLDVLAGLQTGSARAYDGADGALIWSADGYVQVFGIDGLRDVTGDGVPDVAAATGDGQALLLSGADGAEVWSYGIGDGSLDEAAEVVAIVPDMDGNNAPEIAVGSRHGELALLASTGEDLSTDSEGPAEAVALALEAPFPNPARGAVTVGYALPEAGPVRLALFDLLGRRVRTLVDAPRAAGSHRDRLQTGGLASGVYVVRLEAGGQALTQRVVLLR